MTGMSTTDLIAIAAIVGAVFYLFMGSGPKRIQGVSTLAAPLRTPRSSARTMIEAMADLQKEAAAGKLEQLFADHPDNPHLAPLAGLAPKPTTTTTEAAGPKSGP